MKGFKGLLSIFAKENGSKVEDFQLQVLSIFSFLLMLANLASDISFTCGFSTGQEGSTQSVKPSRKYVH
jgi:hypothetical protein